MTITLDFDSVTSSSDILFRLRKVFLKRYVSYVVSQDSSLLLSLSICSSLLAGLLGASSSVVSGVKIGACLGAMLLYASEERFESMLLIKKIVKRRLMPSSKAGLTALLVLVQCSRDGAA